MLISLSVFLKHICQSPKGQEYTVKDISNAILLRKAKCASCLISKPRSVYVDTLHIYCAIRNVICLCAVGVFLPLWSCLNVSNYVTVQCLPFTQVAFKSRYLGFSYMLSLIYLDSVTENIKF